MIIYENNNVQITADKQDDFETKININNENLIWIENGELENFRKELEDVLNKYRI